MIASGEKVVERIHAPVPVELLAYGAAATLRRLGTPCSGPVRSAPTAA